MNRYFLIQTNGRDVEAIREETDATVRSKGDKGPHWFVLRIGRDSGPVAGYHTDALSIGQQERLEAFRQAVPGCALPADWNDWYANDEDEAAKRWYDPAGVAVGLATGPLPLNKAVRATYLASLRANAQ